MKIVEEFMIDKQLKALKRSCWAIGDILALVLIIGICILLVQIFLSVYMSFLDDQAFIGIANFQRNHQYFAAISISLPENAAMTKLLSLTSMRTIILDPLLFIPSETPDPAKAAYLIEIWTKLLKNGLLFYSLFLVWQILRRINREISPFQIKTFYQLRLTGILVVAMAIIPRNLEIYAANLFFKSTLWFSDNSTPMLIMLFGIVILAIAYIFRYGTYLQQESDETL